MKIFVASAWPYVETVPHLGNLVGSVLSADVFARYARLKYGKENVLFVSGSDEHGTPIEIEAIKRKVNPKELTDQAHEYVKNLFLNVWNISYDNYTRTESEVHKAFVKDFLLGIQKYIHTEEEEMPYCENDKIFLPDRFIKGTCPYCGYEDAKGDQCDRCGRLLSPTLLINPRCVICGSKPVIKKTKHWFFDLNQFSDKLKEWLQNSKEMPENVKSVALSWIEEGLKPRSLTRDTSWGIPAPFEGAEGKTIYVWFEALLGYISASIEYFEKYTKTPEGWKDFWFGKDVKSYYFIGKDNIPFHAVIFPAMLLASDKGYNLPSVISSTEYLMYEGQKFSKSRRIGVWIDEAPEIMDIDYWRYILIRLRPEEKDTNFLWREALRIVNTELNDDIGNYINRVLNMINRYFNGEVPEFHEDILDDNDKKLINIIKETPDRVSELFDKGKLKAGSDEILKIPREGNSYLNIKAPWDQIKKNKQIVENTLYIGINSIRTLAILLYPLIPTSANKIYSEIGLKDLDKESWDNAKVLAIKPGHKIGTVSPIFKKIDEKTFTDEKINEIRKNLENIRPSLLR
ncbi:methionine--tRNA ligase [Acidianus sulfidivorans JP7]|uniref:Methionine--tRNA ligase n=1 Tax=Acidianus sulfidivorans JP7 TaxID=619593 RepID=A0A2U9INR9_9CREN|nr:methionine--tRNA ligase [Acidianus sulfidivorans]AWR97614.1 methionine--tRNA ligase [Acidianus sulfidivorans JP7]